MSNKHILKWPSMSANFSSCPVEQSWIKCEDKMPEEDGKYFLYMRNGNFTTIGSFVKGLNKFYKSKLAWISYKLEKENSPLFKDWSSKAIPYKNVTHWMPFPNPPKDEQCHLK